MDRSKRPQNVALINLGRAEPARRELGLLLDDMAEAGDVYEKRSGVEDRIGFERVDDAVGLAGADAAVLGLDVGDACFEEVLAALEPGSIVYAVLACGDRVAEDALGILSVLGECCDEHGDVWGGGVAVAHSRTVEVFARSPRLGFWRRPTSEAVDGLLVAIRCGEEAGNIAAKQGFVRWAACWILRRFAR